MPVWVPNHLQLCVWRGALSDAMSAVSGVWVDSWQHRKKENGAWQAIGQWCWAIWSISPISVAQFFQTDCVQKFTLFSHLKSDRSEMIRGSTIRKPSASSIARISSFMPSCGRRASSGLKFHRRDGQSAGVKALCVSSLFLGFSSLNEKYQMLWDMVLEARTCLGKLKKHSGSHFFLTDVLNVLLILPRSKRLSTGSCRTNLRSWLWAYPHLFSLKMTLTWLWNILRWHFDSDPMYLMYLSNSFHLFTQIFCTKFHHQLWYKVEELVNFQEGGMTFREIMTRIKARSAPFRSIRVGRNVGEVKLRFERWRKIKIWGISWKLMETDGNWWKLMEYVWLIWLYDYVVIQTHQKK